MNTHPYAAAGGTKNQLALTRHVNLFLFNLKNEASELGFRRNDSWALQLVTSAQLTSLKRYHYPIISMKLYPDILLNVFQQVKFKLQQPLSTQETALTVNDMIKDDIKQIAAYPVRSTRD